MAKAKTSSARKINLLGALELLHEMVARSALAVEYAGSPTEATVKAAIDQARKRRLPRDIKPREDQTSIYQALNVALLALHLNRSAVDPVIREEAEERLRAVLET